MLDVSGPIHIFYEAREYDAPLETYFITLNEKQEITSSAGIVFHKLQHYHDFNLSENDWLFIPGLTADLISNLEFENGNQPFYGWIRAQYRQGAKICSICTGAYLLGQAGLLDGKKCTTHWKYLDDFKARFPKADLLNDRLFVRDDRLYSSAGVSSGIDLALFLLEEAFGPVFATKIAKEVVVYLRRTEADPQLSVFLQYRNHIDNRIHEVQDFLGQHLEQKMKIDFLADHVNMSPRNLTRLFKKTVGITIGIYHDKLRVERALQLLADGQKVEAVALSCGLQSTNQLRSLLKKHTSKLPSEVAP